MKRLGRKRKDKGMGVWKGRMEFGILCKEDKQEIRRAVKRSGKKRKGKKVYTAEEKDRVWNTAYEDDMAR